MSDVIRKMVILTITILLFKPFEGISQYVYTDANLQKQLNEARNDVYYEKFNDAVAKYAVLVKNNDNRLVSAEYAYALALAGCYDGAIVNLDKIVANGQTDKDVLFYISQVLKLMEYDTVANVFWTQELSYPPSWISGQHQSFVEKYKRPASINTDDLGTALQRANKLADHRQYIQSMVLFLELIETYPDQYLPCVGLSALLENLGFKNAALDYLQKGIEKMGSKEDRFKIDPYGVYDKHLEKLKSDVAGERDSFNQLTDMSGTKVPEETIKSYLHTGLTYVNKSLAFNVMYGVYLNPTTNFALGLSYSKFENTGSFVGDASINLNIYKNELIGATISTQYSNGFDVGLGARAGWSIPISKTNSSFDVLYNVCYYFKNKETRNSISIGFTHYF